MNSIHIQGGVALQGKVRIQGSKNAALPVLAATLLTKETSCIHNCPRIADVHRMVSILRSLGCFVTWEDGGVRVSPSRICRQSMPRTDMPREAITGMRSSLCLLGALIGKCGEVVMEYPGGCVIGERPIDLHLKALSKMGVQFTEEAGKLHAVAKELCGAEITLPIPSVGATENVLLAAVMAQGDTLLKGAAMEPEVTVLCDYLQSCGAQIEGVGTDTLLVHGGQMLYGTDYRIPADRIVAGTYLLGCIGAGGSVLLEEAPTLQMDAVMSLAERMGGRICLTEEGIYVQAPERPISVPHIKTLPYPEFPTDLQSAALTVLTAASGDSLIEETIFENRFRVTGELVKMGADVEVIDAGRALVHGREKLAGACVEAKELRGGAALVLAGLMAEGETVITGCQYIYRGYENICKDLRELGARIVSV